MGITLSRWELLSEDNKNLCGGAAFWASLCLFKKSHTVSEQRAQWPARGGCWHSEVSKPSQQPWCSHSASAALAETARWKHSKQLRKIIILKKCNFLVYERLFKKRKPKQNQTNKQKTRTINKQLMSFTNRSLTASDFHFRRMLESDNGIILNGTVPGEIWDYQYYLRTWKSANFYLYHF